MNKPGRHIMGKKVVTWRAPALAWVCLILLSVRMNVMGQNVVPDSPDGTLRISQTPDRRIQGDYRHFELDRLGNLFLTGSQGNQITEYNKKGDSISHYDNIRSYGQLSELDVTNPLKIAVYYRDYATIVVLDRYLSPVNTIDLRKSGIWDAQTIATSYDNQYWVYDKQEAKIKKVDGQGRVTFVSNDLRQVFDEGVDPTKLLDRDGLLYAYDPGFGWYIFDYYGALKQKIPIKGLRDPQVTAGFLSGVKANRLWLMATGKQIGAAPLWHDLSSIKVNIRQTLFDGAAGMLWLLTGEGMVGYSVKVKAH